MNTQELKQYIDRVLGNKIRCLLPSFWWKRLFGLVVDKIEDVEGKIEKEVPELIASSIAEFAEKYPDVESRTFYIEGNTEKNAALLAKVIEEYESGIIQQVYLATYFNGETDKLIITSPQLIVANDIRFVNVATPFFTVFKDVIINEDGTVRADDAKYGGSTITIDSALSDTSTNAVQNKVITEAINNKVDKVEGKQLSTEDFTTALKTKLEGMSSFDPTEINNKVDGLQSQINTLVSGDASTTIESFNEIIAFLNGVQDTESLDGIIVGIEQQISAKQDKITDLDTIRSGAALGATSLQEHQDISHLATKDEVTSLSNEVVANEEVTAAALNELNKRINAISENVSGETATKVELQTAVESLTNTILENEEVTAAALNELNARLESISRQLTSIINN
jgi:hypothetical protein